ncbi:MAG: hypothetical protein AAF268_16185 [Cyanobacteria bacterium P01_A01_bin.3]
MSAEWRSRMFDGRSPLHHQLSAPDHLVLQTIVRSPQLESTDNKLDGLTADIWVKA